MLVFISAGLVTSISVSLAGSLMGSRKETFLYHACLLIDITGYFHAARVESYYSFDPSIIIVKLHQGGFCLECLKETQIVYSSS